MSFDMVVVGRTTAREVTVASSTRRLLLDEYLVIEDKLNGNLVGEVIENKSYPKVETNTFSADTGIYQSLKDMKLIDEGKSIYFAKVKLLDEIESPVTPHSLVTTPKFDDIEDLLVPTSPEKGFVLGVIRGTEKIQNVLPDYLKNVAPLYKKGVGVIEQEGVPFVLNHYAFREYPHIGLFGGTGSGKTHGLRIVCEEIMRYGIPGVALDPHYELKFDHTIDGLSENHVMDFSRKHEIFQIGENVGINFTEIDAEELISLMEFIGEMTMPMRGAIEALYQRNDSFTTLFKRINDLKKAMENQERPKNDRENLSDDFAKLYERYRDKVSGIPTLQAISWRLDQLNKTNIFNYDINQVEACMLKRKLAVIRGKVSLLKMLSSYLIRKLYGKRRAYRDFAQKQVNRQSQGDMPPKFPPFFIVKDESHIFAPNGERATPTKLVLREISQEGRKYGVNLALGTQRPSLLDSTIASQLNTKIIFRTGIESDMRMIQTETNLNSEQVTRLPLLSTGNAFVSSATLKKTFYIRFRTTKTTSPHDGHPFDELDEYGEGGDERLKAVLLKFLPLSQDKLPKKHSEINKEMGRSVPNNEIFDTLWEMAEQKEIIKDTNMFGEFYDVIKSYG